MLLHNLILKFQIGNVKYARCTYVFTILGKVTPSATHVCFRIIYSIYSSTKNWCSINVAQVNIPTFVNRMEYIIHFILLIFLWTIKTANILYIRECSNAGEYLHELSDNKRLELIKSLHSLADKHQHVSSSALALLVTQELNKLNDKYSVCLLLHLLRILSIIEVLSKFCWLTDTILYISTGKFVWLIGFYIL